MHGSVRLELENLLVAKPSVTAIAVSSHISSCGDCASQLDAMRAQAQMLKSLQTPEVMEPSAGFYARVLQRIEASAKRSIWWVFVYSPVGKRLAYTSLLVTVALGSYVIAAESMDGDLTAKVGVLDRQNLDRQNLDRQNLDQSQHYDAPVIGSADEQRAAVLQNFASHPPQIPMTSE